jgi:hypothetical protein
LPCEQSMVILVMLNLFQHPPFRCHCDPDWGQSVSQPVSLGGRNPHISFLPTAKYVAHATLSMKGESRGGFPSGGGMGVPPSFKKSPKIGGLGG